MTHEKTVNQKTCLKDNLKKHKKEIITAVIIVSASTAAILGIKYFKSETAKRIILENAEDILTNNNIPVGDLVTEKTIEISVPSYIRNLPFGQKASNEKIKQACELGIILGEGKTLVDGYSYPRKCA